MQGEVRKTRFRLGIVALIALCGALALMLAAPASAVHSKNPSYMDQDNFPDKTGEFWYNSDFTGFDSGDEYFGFDPMETSIPYLAWRGEEVRLVKCLTENRQEDPPDPIQDPDSVPAQWQIIDWSGDEHVWPKFFDDVDQQTNDFEGRGDQENRDCWAIDITSHKAGIAVVKMKVEEAEDEALRGDGDPALVHQFTVIWMNLDRAILRNLEGGEGPAGGPVVVDAPSEDPENRLGVLVKGSVPLNEEFRTDFGLPASIILPDAWVALSNTTLAHISRNLQVANDGIEGNDDAENPTCDDSPDNGEEDAADPTACRLDRGNNDYIPEPKHAPGAFWDIHDSTGPFNSGVYRPDQPLTDEGFGEGDETPKPDHLIHVENVQDEHCDPDGGEPAASTARQVVGVTGNAKDTNDTVDNCDEGEWDSFSRVFHDVSGEQGLGDEENEPTIGPFSHTRPDETLLSDSRLTLNDAPMPAALVLPTILDDPDNPTDAVGSIGVGVNSVDKHLVYNRGAEGQDECVLDTGEDADDNGPEQQHCVNAPFSGAYIPPSPTMESESADAVPDFDEDGANNTRNLDDDQDTASGIHGSFANNFLGYLPVCYPHNSRVWDETGKNVCGAAVSGQNDGLYHYWDTVDVFSERIATDTDCILFDDLPLGPGGDDIVGQTPSGPDQVALYTDEHGEAQFNFVPGLGFFFDELVEPNPAGGCDLQGIPNLGTADIQVNARYPFQPVTHAGVSSNVITKEIRNIFEKNLECQPKAGVAVATTICIVEIIDPFAPAQQIVCFETEPDRAIRRFVGTKHDHFFNNEVVDVAELDEFFCIRTDEDGLGAIEFTTGTLPVTVTAIFVNEPNIARQCTVTAPSGTCVSTGPVVGTSIPPEIVAAFGPKPVPVPGPGGAATVVTPSGGTPNNPPTIVPNQPLKTPTLNTGPKVAKKTASVVFLRIVKPLKQGAVRSLLIRVKSPKKVARIQLKLIGPRGKVLGTVIRTVKTNRTVRVPNLRVPKAVTNVRVKLVA